MKTGCSSGEALQAMKQVCPVLCPERKGYPEGPDHCNAMPGVCYLELGEPCPTYQDYLDEIEGKEGK